MDTTLTIIENFSDHYPALVGTDPNMSGYVAVTGFAIIFAAILLAAPIVFFGFGAVVRISTKRSIAKLTVLALTVLAGFALPFTAYVTLSLNPTYSVQAAYAVMNNERSEQHQELMADIADDDAAQRRVAENIYRNLPVGDTPTDSRETVCSDDNADSILCGGEYPTDVYHEVDENDHATPGANGSLYLSPDFFYDENDDSLHATMEMTTRVNRS